MFSKHSFYWDDLHDDINNIDINNFLHYQVLYGLSGLLQVYFHGHLTLMPVGQALIFPMFQGRTLRLCDSKQLSQPHIHNNWNFNLGYGFQIHYFSPHCSKLNATSEHVTVASSLLPSPSHLLPLPALLPSLFRVFLLLLLLLPLLSSIVPCTPALCPSDSCNILHSQEGVCNDGQRE